MCETMSSLLVNKYFPQDIPLRASFGFALTTRENQLDQTTAAVKTTCCYNDNDNKIVCTQRETEVTVLFILL